MAVAKGFGKRLPKLSDFSAWPLPTDQIILRSTYTLYKYALSYMYAQIKPNLYSENVLYWDISAILPNVHIIIISLHLHSITCKYICICLRLQSEIELLAYHFCYFFTLIMQSQSNYVVKTNAFHRFPIISICPFYLSLFICQLVLEVNIYRPWQCKYERLQQAQFHRSSFGVGELCTTNWCVRTHLQKRCYWLMRLFVWICSTCCYI